MGKQDEKSLQVMIIDDDKYIRESLGTFFNEEKLRFLIFKSASEAFNSLKYQDIDVVISDYFLPDQNGLKFLLAVGDQYPGITRVLMSTIVSDELKNEFSTTGIDALMEKPLNVASIHRILKHIKRPVSIPGRAGGKMKDKADWDWQTHKKECDVSEWENRFNWVEEPHVSPDGEKIACVVNSDEAEFSVCVNGKTWNRTFEKIWSLRFAPDNRPVAIVSGNEEWTVCVDGCPWETWFDYVWELKITPDGSAVGVAVQKDSRYGMAVNDSVWDHLYENITGMVLSDQGTSAAVVQVVPLGQADVDGFSSGIFSTAVEGVAQDARYMNIWDLCFDSKGNEIAYAVRKNRRDYSLVSYQLPWKQNFQFAWKPGFIRQDTSVIAPVRQGGKWRLFRDSVPFWQKQFEQLWMLSTHDETQKTAGVVSDSFGKWTVCENDQLWDFHCDSMISDLFYSDNGEKLIAVFKDKGKWGVVVNGKPWNIRADKLWRPVISDDNRICAARMEKKGKQYLVVNGKIYPKAFDTIFDPEISRDNDKILLKSIRDGVYSREILLPDTVL